MKRLLPTLILFLVFSGVSGQIASNAVASFSAEWHRGEVVFATGDTISCDVRFHNALPVGILQIRSSQTILTIDPEDVKSFTWYDDDRKRTRKFFSLLVTTKEFSSHQAFLESLYDDGDVSILNHKTLGLPYEYMNYTRFISKPSRVNRKYLLDFSTGQLMPMSRENALKLVRDRKEVIAFIQSRGIRFKSLEDYIDVFEFQSSR